MIGPDGEYFTMYPEAVPVLPSSPGEVHVNVIEFNVGLLVAKSVIAAGGIVSTLNYHDVVARLP
jgi:hypothetical protein